MSNKLLIVTLLFTMNVVSQTADIYEPNNDFATAYPIVSGDSIVKNATLIGTDTFETDPLLFDPDCYKINLDAGKMVTILPFGWNDDSLDFSVRIKFTLYDSSKLSLYSGNSFYSNGWHMNRSGFVVPETGTYYLKFININRDRGAEINYGISIHQRDTAGLITLLSPNGGESFNAEQIVPIKWQADSSFIKYSELSIQYSIDNGKSWRDAWYYEKSDGGSSVINIVWRVPHLKYQSDQVLIKIFSKYIQNSPSDISNKAFTILASTNDPFEPNDDFASARAIDFGDSVVKNGIVMNSFAYNDSAVSDTLLNDVDIYKISIDSGRIIKIDATSFATIEENFAELYTGPNSIRLFDASRNQIASSGQYLSCYISRTGIYYIEISALSGTDYWNKYSLSIHQANQITLISPVGGEVFQTGQKVPIKWALDTLFQFIDFTYSVNNGSSWMEMDLKHNDDSSFTWTVPAVKSQTDQALIKVGVDGITNAQFDITKKPFTITAAPMDIYEPNNDISSAYPISLGDSAVSNAWTFSYADSSNSEDRDYYKIILRAGSLLMIRCLGNIYPPRLWDEHEELYSISNLYRDSSSVRFFKISDYDSYYICLKPYNGRSLEKYNLSVNTLPILAMQESILHPEADSFSSPAPYRSQYIDNLTKLKIDFKLLTHSDRKLTTVFLALHEFAPLADEKVKVKAFAIFLNSSPSEQISADITIPYNYAELNGYPEKSLAVACQNFAESDQWLSIPSSIDTVKKQISIHLAYLDYNIFQVYLKAGSAFAGDRTSSAPVFGIQTKYSSLQNKLAIHLSLPKSSTAEFHLYNLQGKCVRKNVLPARSGNSVCWWDFNTLSAGKYILRIKAGEFHKQETLFIVR